MFDLFRSKKKDEHEEKSLSFLVIPHGKIHNDSFKMLPIDIVLEILDYICGDEQLMMSLTNCHDQALNKQIPRETPFRERKWTPPAWDVNSDFNELKFDEKKFFKQYFGKFPNRDSSCPRLLFRKLDLGVDRYSPKELCRLIQIVNYGNKPIVIEKTLARQILQCIRRFGQVNEDKEKDIEKKMFKYLRYVLRNGLCERVIGLDIAGIETFPSLINELVLMCPNIEHVNLGSYNQKENYHAKQILMKDVNESMMILKLLKSFRWTGHHFGEGFIDELSKHTPLLEKLVLKCETSVICCHEAILNWKNLKLIVSKISPHIYSRNNGTAEDLYKFFKNISQLDKLEKLVLNENNIKEGNIQSLPHSLTCLDLSNTQIPDNFLQIVASLPQLKSLGLNCYYGGRDSLKHLVGLKHTLEELHITQSSSCGDEGVMYISQIESLKRLFLMNLSQDQINDTGGYELAKLKNLEIVGLEYCYISHKTVNSIAASCPNIKKIHIDGCHNIKKHKLSKQAFSLIDDASYAVRISEDL
ncbi:predicted protein [Naegleria gruberi]|uniref:Predicted protein n=1 Tax=Naegleria gruberi TaxID=5762 RepID=D2VTD1_NAEGR|nr:uncharacterized protein NAEGRDRAFT_72257 [Naegleria gruberi]EFC39841.1 predicted protein [Naegleria gruberi]|eukprot:XP_002672585.1 predicted protein [Naegleria gruberi strain NEG-M]